ncbi:MAG: hypothetical protein A4E67_00246 [Syntrophaceae bacterium PtaB.Bin038]|nr:MAG: hypothetical protein A4E67_00246 [Syntrophaceae bacterium PtaB.Bin038]
MKWLRLYVDILDDEKIARMSDRTYRIFTYLLLLSREREQEGTIDMSLGDVAWRLRMPEKDIAKAIADLKALNILFEDNSSIQFINWSKRQFRSDDVNSRVQRFRGKKINKHETFHETLRETLDVTAPETETETEKEKLQKEKFPETLHRNKKPKIEFDGSHFVNIPDDLKAKWISIAPGVSVEQEITKAEAWVLSNPKLKKSNWSRFLTNWIVKAQDRAVRTPSFTGGNGNGAHQHFARHGKPQPRPAWEDEADRINAEYFRRKTAAPAADGEA